MPTTLSPVARRPQPPCQRVAWLLGSWLVLVVGLGVLGLGATASADDAVLADPNAAGLTQRERLDALVDRVKKEQANLDTMRARFTQHKESALLVEPHDSRGLFLYKAPDRVRWEYEAPDPRIMTIRGEEMFTYYPEERRAESVSIGRITEQVFKYLGAAGSLETLMKYFSVSAEFPDQAGEPYHLTLLPRYESVRKRLQSMEMWIDGEGFLPTRVRYVEKAGDVTEYTFEDLEVNVDIPESQFEVVLPAGVEVEKLDLRQRGR